MFKTSDPSAGYRVPLACKDLLIRKDVADLLCISEKDLCFILYGKKERSRYVVYKIPKKRGGYRNVSIPSDNISILQKKLLPYLVHIYQPKPSTHGFVLGRSNATNASIHCQQRWVLNLDLVDFFHEIHVGRIISALKQEPYNIGGDAAKVIAQIATRSDGKLPQGGRLSPVLSNIVCRRLDDRMQVIAKKSNAIYTRYADDLSFSTSRPSVSEILLAGVVGGRPTISDQLVAKIRDEGFQINSKKLTLRKNDSRQMVTGLSVNELPNVARSYVRGLDSIIQCWTAHGRAEVIAKHLQTHPRLAGGKPGRPESHLYRYIQGKVGYLESAKGPHDPVVRRLKLRFLRLDDKLFKSPQPLSKLPSVPLRGVSSSYRSWERILRRTGKSVLMLVITKDGVEHTGTCFVVGDYTLATAGHNLYGIDSVKVIVDDMYITPASYQEEVCEASGVDVGIISFSDAVFRSRPKLSGCYRLPEIGEHVCAVGYPSLSLRQPTIVSHFGQTEALPTNYSGVARFIQVSFHAGGGLSGGPVLDRKGNVLGVMASNVYFHGKSGLTASDSSRTDTSLHIPSRPYGQAIPYELLAEWRRSR